jgi:hypothetical protein
MATVVAGSPPRVAGPFGASHRILLLLWPKKPAAVRPTSPAEDAPARLPERPGGRGHHGGRHTLEATAPHASSRRHRLMCAVGGLFALVPVFMPWSWMAATHRWLGLGEMPTGPIVEYLARSLSAFYALVGALCLAMASDLDRYRPLVRFFGVCLALLGIVFTVVDLAAGMPWWWTALEGPGAVPIGALVYVLARPVHRGDSSPDRLENARNQ